MGWRPVVGIRLAFQHSVRVLASRCFTSQAENVHFMGWRPTRVTYTSDYFDQLYDMAVELIKRGKAYVCHQSKAEMEKSKEHAR